MGRGELVDGMGWGQLKAERERVRDVMARHGRYGRVFRMDGGIGREGAMGGVVMPSDCSRVTVMRRGSGDCLRMSRGGIS